ncbi:head maturation protease, ClpP-related [Jeongeupia naejangsanensis]|uniref:ATP-dependent Clp protease proteolytic subunit n=1 Tax=Jeongeupia naejangsanensis TaxID=613195 RepID=A0ABS2BG17_9NEIS|nr:head maturation protease, ClpP-related [Jeongeupia naejangsanensis]MBM3114557.1 Clp protease ClpP [Jeongeupia naejangsanensis]
MRQLLNLLISNRQADRRFEVVQNQSGGDATLYLYDCIVATQAEADWWGGVAADTVAKKIAAIDAPTIHVRINSPGGDVFGGRAIETALRQHPAQIHVHVDGLAASAASFIAMAGDVIAISPGAFVMIHQAQTLAYGSADALEKTAGLLRKVDATLVDTYVTRTKQDDGRVRDWVHAETWFTAAEAVEYGFADQLADDSNDVSACWNLSAYAKAPIAASVPPENPVPPEPAAPAGQDDQSHRQRAANQRRVALLNLGF